jgi:hypothetical protein
MSYFQLLEISWDEILTEVDRIPVYDEDAGRRDLRLYILLSRSQNAFYRDSVNSSLDTVELEETFEWIKCLDNLIEKWGL